MISEQMYHDVGMGTPPPIKDIVITMIKVLIIAAAMAVFVWGVHAVRKHVEAKEIHRCLENNGPDQIWKSMSTKQKGENKFYYVCQIDKDTWGFSVFIKNKMGELIEKTSFTPGRGAMRGSYESLIEYLSGKATRIPLP